MLKCGKSQCWSRVEQIIIVDLYDIYSYMDPHVENGESIMVEVAAGPSEKSEKLPVVIRVPRLQYSALTLCEIPMSLLGFGDIIVPGLLVAYCKRFDVRTSSSSIYYISCTIGRCCIIGLVAKKTQVHLGKREEKRIYNPAYTILNPQLIQIQAEKKTAKHHPICSSKGKNCILIPQESIGYSRDQLYL
ncbi:hypothetical protein AB205_0093730 [Aquarana catesbeiana]|uniref:Uncharacterized protein n=1 Tax=Aquarana catesbeiana TaxID=8400 RepID=A0A2G9S0G6_AQUCT|nr:hypothetical protein AB205_0093730 [Aquarana catesbeiana]